MKRVMMLLLALVLAAGCTMGWSEWKTQMTMAEKLVRLHVIANSDSGEDQAKKLLVRDAVLAAAQEELKDCHTRREAEHLLGQMLPQLERVAEQALGEETAVTASLSREMYPRRQYDTFSLPAGEYLSLQVKIGEAAGKNWWCVVFPPLCLAATTKEVEDTALAAGFGQEEAALLVQEEGGIQVRFRLLEWICQAVS